MKTKKEKNKPSWSKVLLLLLFINFFVIEFFIGWVTVQSFSLAFDLGINPDFSPLLALIGAVISETISYGIYCAKSKAENTKGGVVYDLAMKDQDDETVG